VAKETGGIILVRSDVRDVVTGIRLSRATLWGAVQIALDERRQRAARRSAGLIQPKERIR
jgi:hypothetical protein